MVYWFFRYGYAVAIYLVWPALLMAGGLVVVALSRGREGRRSLHTSSPRRNRLVRDLAAAAAGFAVFNFVLLAAGGREGWLLGPPSRQHSYLALAGVGVLLIPALAAYATHLLIRDGGWLRDRLNHLRKPVRRRGEMGSAQFCTPREYVRFNTPDLEGLAFLGAFWGADSYLRRIRRLDRGRGHFCLSVEDVARGILTIGGPGSGKTQSVILPSIADWMAAGRSVVVVDPQQELTDFVKHFAAVTGHAVIVHDPTSPTCPRFNLDSHIRDVSEATAIADVLLPVGQEVSPPTFWRESAQALLAACLLRYDTVGDILLALGNLRDLGRILGQQEDNIRLLATPFLVSSKDNKPVAAGIAATLAAALTGWADERVRAATATSDFSASHLIAHPTAIILTCPGRQRATYARYLGAVLRKLMLDLDTIAEGNGGALPAPVAMVIDEFPTLGKLDGLASDVNLVRKRRIGILIAAQTKGQFHLIYGRAATDALFAGLATQIIFGGCDQETADYYSHASGLTTEPLMARLGVAGQVRQRLLLTPDEIQSPARGNATVFSRYVTETHANQVILFARLTRLYERDDWAARLAAVYPDAALILERPSDESDRLPGSEIAWQQPAHEPSGD